MQAAIVNLRGLWDEDDSDDNNDDNNNENRFEEQYSIASHDICNEVIKVRQFSFHVANANFIWPGALDLAQYIDTYRSDIYTGGKILELGSATGFLAIFLAMKLLKTNNVNNCNDMIVTSDIDDDGIVEQNIKYNFQLNNIDSVVHIPHTWGTGWTRDNHQCSASSFKYIVASDILLYVKVYPELVSTLTELFNGGTICEFIMSWKRRIAESKVFFDLMTTAGFHCMRPENCSGTIYIFTRK